MEDKLDSLEIQAMTINNKIDYIKKVLKIAEKTENSAQLKILIQSNRNRTTMKSIDLLLNH